MWGKFARRIPQPATQRETVVAPDGETLELRHLTGASEHAPRLLLLHGLEGGPGSHYVGGILDEAHRNGWNATLLVFRGCGEARNEARRFYHSGETSDLDFVFRTLSARWSAARWCVAGVSLGGNVVLKWLGERGDDVNEHLRAAVAISVPFDLEAGARHISKGFAKVYDRSFLKSLRRKAVAKLSRYPDLFDRARLDSARTIFDFDEAVTGPVHGFGGARDYYEKSSSQNFLPAIRVPTLLLSAADDPFLPSEVLERVQTLAAGNRYIETEFHDIGGHVGFVAGTVPWRPVYYAERRLMQFCRDRMERE
jgi:uncharacterized protein